MIALAGRRGAVLDRLPEREGANVAGFDLQEVPRWPGQQDTGRGTLRKHALECDAGLGRTTGSR
jgi:hypothetical protein